MPLHASKVNEVLGERVFRRITDIPGELDLVDVFRRSEDIPAHRDDMLAQKPTAVRFELTASNSGMLKAHPIVSKVAPSAQ